MSHNNRNTQTSWGRRVFEILFGIGVLAILPPQLLELAIYWTWRAGVAVFFVFLLLPVLRRVVVRLGVPFLDITQGGLTFAMITGLYFFGFALALLVIEDNITARLYSLEIGGFAANAYNRSWERYDPEWRLNKPKAASPIKKSDSGEAPAITETQAIAAEILSGSSFTATANNQKLTVRLIGVDAPRTGLPLAKESKDLLIGLIKDKNVTLVADRDDKNMQGDLLRYVYSDEIFVNSELIRVGLAKHKPDPVNQEYDFLFRELEDQAKKRKLGLWAAAYIDNDKPVQVKPTKENKLNPETQPDASIF